jgi:outer membrane protein OmpA-like peptidoglycan-associated protein
MKKYFVTISFLLIAAALGAQQQYEGKIKVKTKEATHRGDSIYFDMDIMMEGISVSSDRSLTLTPLLVTDDRNVALPSVLINGTVRQRLYRRGRALNPKHPDNYYQVVESKRSVERTGSYIRTIPYHVTIPYENWMYNSRVVMEQDLCGCAGHQQQISIEPLVNQLSHEISVVEKDEKKTVVSVGEYTMHPQLAYIRPQIEAVKERGDSYEVNLHFPLGKTDILPNFDNNQWELNHIEEMVNKLQADNNLTITKVTIQGNASLEGSEATNQRLSAGRALALLNYLKQRLSFPSNLYQLAQGGEDWSMFAKEVQENPLLAQYRDELQHILDMNRTPDQKEAIIRALNKGTVYRLLLGNIFPSMRRVLCNVDYVVKPFSTEEAKAVYSRSPQLLSLDEMYRLASSYDSSDQRFGEVFETAARLFPDSEIANLNAAASSLQWGNVDRAKSYLDKASPGSAAYANNQGVYLMLKGNYTEAAEWLHRAVEQGSKEAVQNQKELQQKLQSLNQGEPQKQ